MKRFHWLLLSLCLLPVAASPTLAQSFRLSSLSEQLVTQSEELAERSYSEYSSNSFSNRSDVEALFLAQQFSASATAFRRMVTDGRRESELRDAATILSELARRAESDFSRRSQWSEVQRTIGDLSRELNVIGTPGGGGGGGRGEEGGRTTGRLRWRGTVDDDIQLIIRDDQVEVRTIGGTEYSNATYNFTSPLPRRRGLNVNAVKLKGRGEVRVLQQPSRDNDFTAVIQIRDSERGPKEYEVEITW